MLDLLITRIVDPTEHLEIVSMGDKIITTMGSMTCTYHNCLGSGGRNELLRVLERIGMTTRKLRRQGSATLDKSLTHELFSQATSLHSASAKIQKGSQDSRCEVAVEEPSEEINERQGRAGGEGNDSE